MSFEIKEKDLLARIGRLKTRSGTVETPLLFPVVNPVVQSVSPRRMREEFGFEALITNAYILRRHFQRQLVENDVHKLLDFDGTIMTDSGAYQILVYGDIDVTPKEIVEFQEHISPEIATILDIPTGWKVTGKHAQETVNETLRRAKKFFTYKTREDILWVGPVQGGHYLELVAKSAQQMSRLPFDIYALGSPTEVMERYRFDVLVDMILAAKTNLPIEKPLHLFGAGHPFMLALAVALGCDLFDSAAYALFAKENRYMTETGTLRLGELEYFPCTCPKCTRKTPKQIQELPKKDQQIFLTEHNLYVCTAELKRIKQTIREGRLWEHLEMRAHSHPSLLQALKRLRKYQHFLEKHDPAIKNSGLFYFSSIGLVRPEILRYSQRLRERYSPPGKARTLLLMPQGVTKPFHKSNEFRRLSSRLRRELEGGLSRVHVCFYTVPFGVVPIELDEIYPLSQHESVLPFDNESALYVSKQVGHYIDKTDYKTVILFNNPDDWGNSILKTCRKSCSKKKIQFKSISIKNKQHASLLVEFEKLIGND